MSVTIDSLDIQIRSSAGSATKNIEELARALEQLNGQAKVTKIVNSLEKLNSALTNLRSNSSVMGQLSALSKSLSGLASLPKLTGLQSAITQLRRLPDVINGLDDAKLAVFTTRLRNLTKALTPLATQLDKIGTAFSRLPNQVSKVVTATNRMTTATRSSGNALNTQSINLMSVISNLQTYLSVVHFVGDAVSKVMADAIEWDGVQSRFGRAFGESAKESLEWVDKLSEGLLINKQEFMQYSSLFAEMLSGFGVNQIDAGKMAIGYTELAYDIWAAYNDVYKSLGGEEGAIAAVRSAIAGEVEPIRRAGFTIVDSQLAATAATYGLEYSTQKATEAQKSYLRYVTLVDQAIDKNIIGVYAAEMQTAEGAVRTLTQQMKTLGQAIGSLFLPILQAVVPYMTVFVQLLYEAAEAVAGMFGIPFFKTDWSRTVDNSGLAEFAQSASDSTDALDAAGAAAKKLKHYTMGFDELNIIDPTSASGSAGAAGAGGLGWESMDVDSVWNESLFKQASKQVDELKEKIKSYIEEHKAMLTAIGAVGGFLTFMKVLRGLNSLLGITKTIGNLKTAFLGLGTAIGLLKTAGGNVKAFFELLKAGGGLGESLAAAFPSAANILSTIGGAFKTALTNLPSTLANMIKAIPGWGWIVTAIVTVLTLAIVNYDFYDISYKLGNALGTAFKKVGDFLRGAGEWIAAIGEGIIDGIGRAIEIIREKGLAGFLEIGKDILLGLWNGIVSGWENFWGNIAEMINGFVDGFKDALGIHSPSTVFAEIGGFMVQGFLNGITEKWTLVKKWFTETVAPKFTKAYWTAKWEAVRAGTAEKLEETKQSIIEKFNGITSWFAENVAPKLTIEYWKQKFDGIRQGASEKMAELKNTFTEKWDAIKLWFTSNVAPKFSKEFWLEKFVGLKNAFVETVKNMINAAILKLNQFIDWCNDALKIEYEGLKNPLGPGWIIPPMSIQLATIPNIPYFAEGGFPEMGQMFIAREAGPELVGNINGRTAVANNDQIVTAVSQGVYEAVVAAMGSNRNSSGNQSINVYLDGKQIYANVKKRDSERGMQLIGDQLGYAY